MEIKKRLRIWRITAVVGWWKLGVALFTVVSLYDLASSQIPQWNLPAIGSFKGIIDWKFWLIIALLLALLGTLEGVYRYVRANDAKIAALKTETESKISESKRADLREMRRQFSDKLEIPELLFKMYERAKQLADTSDKLDITNLEDYDVQSIAKTMSLGSTMPETELDVSTLDNIDEVVKVFQGVPLDGIPIPDGANPFLIKLKKVMVDLLGGMGANHLGTLEQIQHDTLYPQLSGRLAALQVGLPHNLNLEIDECVILSQSIANFLNFDESNVVKSEFVGMQLQFLIPSMDSWVKARIDTISGLLSKFFLGED